MGITGRISATRLRALVDNHPQLRAFHSRLTTDHRIDAANARRLITGLVTCAIEDFGQFYLGEMVQRMRRIESLRGRIAGAVDHVIAEGLLPPDLDHNGFSRLLNELRQEMARLRSPREQARITPGMELKRLLSEPPKAPAVSMPPPLPGQWIPEPKGALHEAMSGMTQRQPKRAAIFRSAMDEHPDAVARTILAETEEAQQRAIRNLREMLGSDYSPENWNELVAGIEELGRAQHRARTGPGSSADVVREAALAQLPPELRAAIGGDRTILGPIAEANPEQLIALWNKWLARGDKSSGFRKYVWNEGSSFFRPLLAEWQAAHELSAVHGLSFLKDAAHYVEVKDAPPIRVVNPREGGTDLLGVRADGELWYIDDKSHRLSQKQRDAGQTGINLSSVSAFEGKRFIQNIRDDIAEIEASFERVRKSGYPSPDAHHVDAVNRLRNAADALEARTRGWSDADFLQPENLKEIRSILDGQRIRLFVTSTMGDVTGMTNRLHELGITVLPPFPASGNSGGTP